MSETKFCNQYSVSTTKVKTKSNQTFFDHQQRSNYRNDGMMMMQSISVMLVKTTRIQNISLLASGHWNDSRQTLNFACRLPVTSH